MTAEAVPTSIPSRLDGLPWSGWHSRVVVALGTAWLLDGLEVTVVGSLGAMLQRPEALGLSTQEVAWSGAVYVAGAVLGALVFGRQADRLGRKRLFMVTLGVYLAATLATAFSTGFITFASCRFATGLGIGGEYAAINSAIDELIPARVRGTVDLGINGSFWIGAALGAALSLVLLDPRLFEPSFGWRLAFGMGAALGFAIALVRRHVPESPRWLIAHGRIEEAERIMAGIEARALKGGTAAHTPAAMSILTRPPVEWLEIVRLVLSRYRVRSALGLTLMAAQAFFYNAIFFTYALVLSRFYGVPDERVGLYIFPFAVANFAGPLLLGPLFDRVGRRTMICTTYGVAGLGLLASGYAFQQGWLDAAGQAWAWAGIFFVASAAASSAYLTVSEVFPVEIRAVSISIFYALGTAAGGVLGPVVFGALVAQGSRDALFTGYALAAALMCVAAVVAFAAAVDAERKPLEEIARPLSAA